MRITSTLLVHILCLVAGVCLADERYTVDISSRMQPPWTLTFKGSFTIVFSEEELERFEECMCASTENSCVFYLENRAIGVYVVKNTLAESMSDKAKITGTYTCTTPTFTLGVNDERIECRPADPVNITAKQSCYPSTSLQSYLKQCPCIDIWWIPETPECNTTDIVRPEIVPCGAYTTPVEDHDNSVTATISNTSSPAHTTASSRTEQTTSEDSSSQGHHFTSSAVNQSSMTTSQAFQSTTPSVYDESRDTKSSDTTIEIALGASCCVLAVVAMVVVVAFYMKRRKNNRSKEKPIENNVGSKSVSFRATPNQYMQTKTLKKGKLQTVTAGYSEEAAEDNYGYADYVEPGSAYCVISDDGVTVKDPDSEIHTQSNNHNNKTKLKVLVEDPNRKAESFNHVSSHEQAERENVENSTDLLTTYNVAVGKIGSYVNAREDRPPNSEQYELQRNPSADKAAKSKGGASSKLKAGRNGTAAEIPRDLLATYNIGKFGGGAQPQEDTDNVRYSLQKDINNTGDPETESNARKVMEGQATPDVLSDLPTTYDVASRSVVEGGVESSDTVRYSLQKDLNPRGEMKADVNVYSRLNAGRDTTVPNDVLSTYNAASGTFDGNLQGRDNVDTVRYSLQKDQNPYDETDQETNVYTQPDSGQSGKATEVSSDVLATYNVAAGTFRAGVEKRKHVTYDATPSNDGEDEAESPYDAYRISYAKAKPISEGPGAEASTNNVIGDDLGDLAGRGHDRGKGHGRDVDEYSSLDARRSGAPEYCMLQDGAGGREGREEEKDAADGERGSGAGAGNEYFVLEDEVVGEEKGAIDGECVSGTDAGNEYFVLEDEVVTAGKEDEEYREDQEGEDGYSLGKVM